VNVPFSHWLLACALGFVGWSLIIGVAWVLW
jgi:hypothetical protein